MNRTFVATPHQRQRHLDFRQARKSKSYAKPQACANPFSLMSLQPND
jgi:hypothetical protein